MSSNSHSVINQKAIWSPLLAVVVALTGLGCLSDGAVTASPATASPATASSATASPATAKPSAVPRAWETSRTQGGARVRFSSASDWNLKGENLSARGSNPLYFPLEAGFRYIMVYPDHPWGELYIDAGRSSIPDKVHCYSVS